MDEIDKRLNELTPTSREQILQCPNCDNDLSESTSFGVKVAATVVVSMPVLLVILDFVAKWNDKPYAIDDKILGCCLAGIALMLAFGFKRKKG